MFSLVFRVTGKLVFWTGKATLLNYFSTITLKWKYHDAIRNVACTTIGSNTSRESYKTLDVCDSCYKERLNVQINVEKKKFKATSATSYRELRLEDKTNSLQRLQLRPSRRFNTNSNLRTNLNKPTYVQINVEKTTLISYDNARTKKCQGDTTNNISIRNTPN